jgi:hypothetical protein
MATKKELAEWRAQGIKRDTAKPFVDLDIKIEQAQVWFDSPVYGTPSWTNFVSFRFTPEQAEEWLRAGVDGTYLDNYTSIYDGSNRPIDPLDEIIAWQDAGFTPKQRSSWRRGSMRHDRDPETGRYTTEWEELFSFTIDEVKMWQKVHIQDGHEAYHCIELGYTPEMIAEWTAVGFRWVGVIRPWVMRGCSPAEARRWHEVLGDDVGTRVINDLQMRVTADEAEKIIAECGDDNRSAAASLIVQGATSANEIMHWIDSGIWLFQYSADVGEAAASVRSELDRLFRDSPNGVSLVQNPSGDDVRTAVAEIKVDICEYLARLDAVSEFYIGLRAKATAE